MRSTRRIITLLILFFGPVLASACRSPETDIGPYLEILSERRGLEPLSEVKYSFEDRESIRRFLLDELELEIDDDGFETVAKVNELFGLIPEGFPLKNRLVELYLTVPGLYLPYQHRLVMRKGLESRARDSTLVHELTHAMQDQHFNLGRRLADAEANGDLAYALRCLAEGDATAVQLGGGEFLTDCADPVAVLRSGMGYDPERMGLDIPPALLFQLENCYVLGLGFVEALHRRGGWEQVNSAYGCISSTEQIIHPVKYLSLEYFDPPVGINSSLLGKDTFPGYQLLSTNTHGEYMAALILRQRVNASLADTAAAGWGGDRYWVFEPQDNEETPFYIWLTVWDSENDASEFIGALDLYFALKYPRAGVAHGIGETDEIYFGYYADGKRVVVFDGMPRLKLQELAVLKKKLLATQSPGGR